MMMTEFHSFFHVKPNTKEERRRETGYFSLSYIQVLMHVALDKNIKGKYLIVGPPSSETSKSNALYKTVRSDAKETHRVTPSLEYSHRTL